MSRRLAGGDQRAEAPASPAPEREIGDVWSERAEAYRTAADQAAGDDLELLVSWAEGGSALDVASGGGHTARRLREAGFEVITLDPAPGMRADVLARAEDIPFGRNSFDVVTCRIAPHHFTDVREAVREMARVARRLVLIEDTLYESEEIEQAEQIRDPTHVRSYSEAEWRELLEAAGLVVEEVRILEKSRPFADWLARAGCKDEEAVEVEALVRDHLDGENYLDRKILVKARKTA